MRQLESLVDQARQLADGGLVPSAATDEVARQLQICNACRYCEGFCAVFPAMTRRLSFEAADVHYLANLCHNCGACLHACQYASPHEFAVNVPQAMARVRGQTYTHYAWPQGMGRLYQRNGLTVALALAVGLSLLVAWVLQSNGGLWGGAAQSGFAAVLAHNALVALFAPVFVWALLALGMGVRRFLRDLRPATTGQAVAPQDARQAASEVLRLRYLDGGHGEGCHNEDEGYTLSRSRAHHLTFYGFMLCFAATSVATLYHYVFGWHAPYELPNLPKLLGAAGGISLLVGTSGLFRLYLSRDVRLRDTAQRGMDLGFIALLWLTSATGLGLWLSGGTAAVALWLALHLGVVLALFLTLPYGKFAHGIYRCAALLRHAVEQRQPSRLTLGSE